MMLTPRVSIPVLGALAALTSVAAIGCAEPCDHDQRCVDESVQADQTRALQAPPDATVTPVKPLDASAAGSGITFSVEGTASATLAVAGATCGAGRCTLATVPTGEVRVDLTLSSHGTADMPVWVRWRGCTPAGGQLWPVWNAGPNPEYQTLYTHGFVGLTAGSQCVAEVVQGSWYIFAGDRTLKATTNAQYCREQYSSLDNLNLHCFIPAKEKVGISSGLRSWECYKSATPKPIVYKQASLTLTSVGNEVLSCMGRAL
jgi:hypothetical protein